MSNDMISWLNQDVSHQLRKKHVVKLNHSGTNFSRFCLEFFRIFLHTQPESHCLLWCLMTSSLILTFASWPGLLTYDTQNTKIACWVQVLSLCLLFSYCPRLAWTLFKAGHLRPGKRHPLPQVSRNTWHCLRVTRGLGEMAQP